MRSASQEDTETENLYYRLKNHPIFEIPNIKRCVDIGGEAESDEHVRCRQTLPPPFLTPLTLVAALDMEMVALLNIIVPGLAIPETPSYLELDKDTKEVLLQDLLVEVRIGDNRKSRVHW